MIEKEGEMSMVSSSLQSLVPGFLEVLLSYLRMALVSYSS
jgi:hypothetical protein